MYIKSESEEPALICWRCERKAVMTFMKVKQAVEIWVSQLHKECRKHQATISTLAMHVFVNVDFDQTQAGLPLISSQDSKQSYHYLIKRYIFFLY